MRDARKVTTDREVSALKPGEKPFEVAASGARGLVMRVFPNGGKSWEWRYVAPSGVRRRLPLGPYPGLSLAKARERAMALRVEVVEGGDPAGDRAAKRQAARTGETLEEIAAAYFKAAEDGAHRENASPKRPSTLTAEKVRWRTKIEPKLGKLRVKEIKRADVRAFMHGLAFAKDAVGEPVHSADYVASIGRTLSAIFAYAIFAEVVETNPVAGQTRPRKLKARERLFDDAAVGKLWKALGPPEGAAEGDLSTSISLALRFTVVTLCRRGEVAGARWSEVDLKARTFTVPAERAKAGRAHVVPLSDAAMAVLAEAARLGNKGFVFPSAADPKRHVAEASLTRQVSRLCIRLEIPHGSPHDVRRTAATALASERFGVRPIVISRLLAHAAAEGAAVTNQVYLRYSFLPECRAALSAWSEHVIACAEGREAAPNLESFAAHG